MRMCNMMRDKRCALSGPSAGFTLLEVMVALAIIAIALTAIFHMQSQTIVMANSSQFYTVAPLLADQKMAEIQAGIEQGETGAGEFGEDHAGYAWQFQTEPVELEVLGEASEDLKKIEVTVSYDEDAFTFTLRRYQMSMPQK